jgi:hypothetical protein
VKYCLECRTEYRDEATTCADCGIPLVSELPPMPEPPPFEPLEFEAVMDVFTASEAAMVRSLMDGEGITYYFKGDIGSLGTGALHARLMVEKDRAEEARQILSVMTSPPGETSGE